MGDYARHWIEADVVPFSRKNVLRLIEGGQLSCTEALRWTTFEDL